MVGESERCNSPQNGGAWLTEVMITKQLEEIIVEMCGKQQCVESPAYLIPCGLFKNPNKFASI